MLTKNEIKDIQSLSHKKHRDQEGLFVVEGPKMAYEILQSHYTIKKIYATEKWLNENDAKNNAAVEISENELARISHLQTPNEVVIVAFQQIAEREPDFHHQLTLLLDGIQDPGNLGTIIRIADWFGIQQIICTPDCVELYNPKVVQSTMGSMFRVTCLYRDVESLNIPKEIPVYGAMLTGQNVFSIHEKKIGILVIGNESKGIRPVIAQKITHAVTIPKIGKAESLNAAVATGIIVAQMIGNTTKMGD